MGRKLPPEKIKGILELYEEGYSISEIARKLNVSRQTVSKYIKIYNLDQYFKHHEPLKRLKALIDVFKGKGYDRIKLYLDITDAEAEYLKANGFTVEKIHGGYKVELPEDLSGFFKEVIESALEESNYVYEVAKVVFNQQFEEKMKNIVNKINELLIKIQAVYEMLVKNIR